MNKTYAEQSSTRHRKGATIFILTITLLLLASCAQQASQIPAKEPTINKGVSAGGDDANVRIKGMKFVPNNLNIKTGTTVTWRNEDPVPHNVISDDETLQSQLLQQGDTWSYTFDKAGTYSYICGLHSGMKGSIVVE